MKSISLSGLALALSGLLLAVPARAADVVVRFETTQPTVWGESAYVLGDLPALGGGDRARALRMRPSSATPHRWELDVALPAGTPYRWLVLVRDNKPGAQGDARNGRVVSSVRQDTAPGNVEERRVRARYLSGFAAPRVVYERRAGRWEEVGLRHAGPGRGAGESLWEADLRTELDTLSLYFHDGAGRKDLAPDGGVYRTTRADLVIASGEVLPDVPPARRTASRVVIVRSWYSNTLRNARDLFIYLPRDYDASSRRYPVVYAHDGQNLFDPRAMGGGWRAGETLDREIAAGRVEDVILVGAANTPARMDEYMPPEEGGAADRYGRFLIDELKPWVDATFRTLTGREDTGVLGSSLGGLVSFYLGWERSDVFGRVGSLSGSFWLRAHLDAIVLDAPRDLRVWLDSGTAGSSGDSYEHTVAARDLLLAKGAALGGRVAHEVDVGAGHNETAWRARFGRVMTFLFPAR